MADNRQIENFLRFDTNLRDACDNLLPHAIETTLSCVCYKCNEQQTRIVQVMHCTLDITLDHLSEHYEFFEKVLS